MPAASNPGNNGSLRVAVIGGGIVGLSCALELKQRGADVAVYDRGAELGAGVTIRAAGMLGAAFEWALEADQMALAALAHQAGEIWPEFAAKLERLGGGPVEYSTEGAIVVARTASETGWLEGLAAACQARGLPVKRLSATDIKREERALVGSTLGGLLLPGDRQVDPAIVLQRLGAALKRVGVGLRLGRVVEKVIAGPGFQMPDGEKFDRVVLATGAGPIPKFASREGDPFDPALPEIVPVKGQMLALAPMEGGPRHVVHTRDVYVAPKSRWTLVGATVERGKADTTVDRDKVEELRARAAELMPVLGRAPEVSAWAGVRPGTPDDAPLIGETGVAGVFAALGHYRNGVLFAPATAGIVADQVFDGKVSPLARAFEIRRFDKLDEARHSRSAQGVAKTR
ncbi:MAG TPA: FAD-dependent oxidoreductase [Hyphomonadaceae bacterium]|nr:FAD-dependent oxidoreductase [Hyphomonadaceae bacterium]